MRRLAWMRLAAVGLALSAPAVATAGLPPAPKPAKKAKHLCPDCQMKAMMKADGLAAAPATTVRMPQDLAAHCPECQPAPGMTAPTSMMAEAPGRASVGGMGMSPGMAPMVVSGEPTPIGVVQTGYRPNMPMPPDAMAGMGMNTGMGMGMPGGSMPGRATIGGGAVPPASTPWTPKSSHRPHVLGHLLGLPQRGEMTEMYRERKREEHAALRFGGDAVRPASELPAAMVYGR